MKNLLRRYICASREMQINAKNQIAEAIKDPANLDFLIKNTDNFVFRKLVQDLNLPESIVYERELLEQSVINNYENSSFEAVQNAVCDMLFHTSIEVAIAKITTLKERAQTCVDFYDAYSPYSEFFDKSVDFLSKQGDFSSAEVNQILNEIYSYKQVFNAGDKQVFDVMSDLYSKAEKDFIQELTNSVKATSEKIFKDIKPEEITLQNGEKILYFKIQNQTKNQKNLHLLTRTTTVFPYMTEENAREKYAENVSKYGYFSFSILDELHTKSFAEKSKIRFVFFNIPQNTDILSCTVTDGQTNQFSIEKGKTPMHQQLMSVDKFIEDTGNSYNEIVLTMPKQMLPNAILIKSETPTDEELSVAKAFNIPLIYIDKNCYNKENLSDGRNIPYFNYATLLKHPLGSQPEKTEKHI